MTLRIACVSVGRPAEISLNGKAVLSGIVKSPQDGCVAVNFNNLAGDGQADLRVHGGRDKAIYAYSQEHYLYWANELRAETLESAQFGENLTVAGLLEEDVIIGDSYQAGSAIVTVTQPRIPCFKLGIRMGDETFPRRFLDSGRLGMYLRVEQEGVIQCGDTLDLIDRPTHGISLHDLWRTVTHSDGDANRALQQLPHLDAGWRRRLRHIPVPS